MVLLHWVLVLVYNMSLYSAFYIGYKFFIFHINYSSHMALGTSFEVSKHTVFFSPKSYVMNCLRKI